MREFIINSDDARQDALHFISCLDADKPWRVTIKRYVEKRTLNQNSLLHKWFDTIARETGDDPESVKDALCERFLGLRERTILGKKCMVRKSTADLEIPEMSALMEQVYALAAQFGIHLPVPEDLHWRR